MPWVPFTSTDVRSRLYDAEDETWDAAGGDKIEAIVAQTIAKVRGAVRANSMVDSMGAAGTIPDFFVGDAAVIARAALLGLPPVVEGVTDPRKTEYDKAMEALKALTTMNPKAFADDPSPSSSESSTASYGGDSKLEF